MTFTKSRPVTCLVGLLGLVGLLQAQEPPHTFQPIAGESIAGTLRAVAPAPAPEAAPVVEIALASGELLHLGLDHLRSVTLRPTTGDAGDDRLWLRSGQILPATFTSGSGRGGRFVLPFSATTLDIAWRFVRGARFHAKRADDAGFALQIEQRPESKDLLYALRDDDVVRLSVDFLGVDGDSIRVTFRGQEQSLPVSRVYGLIFGEGSGAPPDRQRQPRVALRLATMERTIEGRLLSMADGTWQLQLDEGVVLALPNEQVASVRVFSDRLVFLSDLQPAVVDQAAAFDRAWPWLIDRGPAGEIHLVGGRAVGRGLVLFPRTRLTWALDGRFDLFKATIGMEESRGEQAHAIFRVLVDGVVRFDSGAVTADAAPRDVEVPITGAGQLSLEADFGKNLDLGDVCVFADARVMKK